MSNKNLSIIEGVGSSRIQTEYFYDILTVLTFHEIYLHFFFSILIISRNSTYLNTQFESMYMSILFDTWLEYILYHPLKYIYIFKSYFAIIFSFALSLLSSFKALTIFIRLSSVLLRARRKNRWKHDLTRLDL